MKARIDHGQRMNDQLTESLQAIVDAMENDNVRSEDFVLPFSGAYGRPYNPATDHRASGVNALLCMLRGITFYSTYEGWQKLGYQVPSGASADLFLSQPRMYKSERVDDLSGDKVLESRLGGFKTFPVWAWDTVKDSVRTEVGKRDKHPIPAKPWEPPQIDKQDATDTLPLVDEFIASTQAKILQSNEGRAFYSPATDTITMPKRELFKATKTSTATECYYSTKLHELVHWTGHKSRMDRLGDKNKRGYAYEELVAEIGSALLCADLNVSPSIRVDHLQYIKSWLQALDNDTKYIVSAGTLSQKAVDFLHKMQPQSQAA